MAITGNPTKQITDARLFRQTEMTNAESYLLDGGEVSVFSARAPEKESANEDAAGLILFSDHAAVLVVADGMGGGRAGEEASAAAVTEVRGAVRRAAAAGDLLRTGIINGFEAANRAVRDMGVGAATTLAVVEVDQQVARPYHVGDSMILITGQRGRIKLQTVSHSPVGFAVESGMLDERDALHHEDRHLVSNVIGSPQMRIEVGARVKLAPRDTLLLATDGLFDNLHIEEIVARMRSGPLAAAADCLARDAQARMVEARQGQPSKPDDLAFVAFRPLRP
ncbi:MAG: serine/threonine-protein phosphatase [Phycisphaerae bacterium]|nr:serine/threonine-protein phosphatase [Phycisphaerae bacterium]